MQRYLRTLLVALAAWLIALLLLKLPVSGNIFHNADLRLLDSFFGLERMLVFDPNRPVYDDILIVAIDDVSLDRLGPFSSWPTLYFSDAVSLIASGAPLLIGLDVFFPDSTGISLPARQRILQSVPDPGSRQQLQNLFELLDNEDELAQAISAAGNVFLAMFDNPGLPSAGEIPSSLQTWDVRPPYLIEVEKPHPPLAVLSESAYGIGFAQVKPDASGIIHDYPLFIGYQGKNYVNFSFQAGLDLLGADSIGVDHDCRIYSSGEMLRRLPLSKDGRFFLKYYSQLPAFRYVSFSDVIQQRIPPEYFEGKIVLVGGTATGLGDLKPTPGHPLTPGVEIHATFMRNLLEEEYIHWLDQRIAYALLIVLVGALVFIVNLSRPLISVLYISLVSLVLLTGFLLLFMLRGTVLEYSVVLLPWGLVCASLIYFHYSTQVQERKKVREAFGHYVADDVIKQIMKDKDALCIGGIKKPVAVLICDIRNFTSLCESSRPNQITNFLNHYFNVVTEIVIARQGMLDKYMGDAVLALFNAPLDLEDYIVQACCAAHQISLSRATILKQAGNDPVYQNFRLGVAVACGEVIVGNMGSDRIFNYTGIGNTMNIASRLEGLNKYYHTSVILDAAAYEAVKDILPCRHLDHVYLKGVNIPQQIYELCPPATSTEFIAAYETALDEMIRGNFDSARQAFLDAQKLAPEDIPTRIMLTRLETLDPHTWTGAWRHEQK